MNTLSNPMSGFFVPPIGIILKKAIVLMVLLWGGMQAVCQPVTGVWRGRIIRGSGLRQSSATVEVKLVAAGDSILGTAYYYGPGKNYVRYALKGYFDLVEGAVVWQDYHMIDMEPKNAKGARSFRTLMTFRVFYSCPDGKTLRLDGSCALPDVPDMQVELRKMDASFFGDEWDAVISGYYTGMNRKEVIDSVWWTYSEPLPSRSATEVAKGNTPPRPPDRGAPAKPTFSPVPPPDMVKKDPDFPEPDTAAAPVAKAKPAAVPAQAPKPPAPAAARDITAEMARENARVRAANTPPAAPPKPAPAPKPEVVLAPPAEKPAPVVPVVANPVMAGAYAARKKIIQTEIPVEGDTLELRFYDNAQVDGDSISLFLNGVALFQHVRLEVRPYVFKISLAGLPAISELAMVAENLGAIPPNTAYMEAIVKGQRYSARLVSTEESSGVIRLVRREEDKE